MSNLSELLPTGGGQNSVEFVASGTLASGQAVALKNDGTVAAISATAPSSQSCSSVFQTHRSVNRAPIGQRHLCDFWVCSFIFKVCYGICGVYIIPKWLINDS